MKKPGEMDDPDIDIQWIPEEGFFVIDGVEITPEILKRLVHSYAEEKTPITTEVELEELKKLEELKNLYENIGKQEPKDYSERDTLDWRKWVKLTGIIK